MPTILDHKERIPRAKGDYYCTPVKFACKGVELLRPLITPQYAVDPGAGTGVWGQALKAEHPDLCVCGVDIEYPTAPGYQYWLSLDYLQCGRNFLGTPDLVIGNPPYALAEQFIRHSLDLVADGGFVLFLLRLAFLESKGRARGLFKEHPPRIVATCDERPVFYGEKNGITAFAYFVWQKGWSGPTEMQWCRIGEG